MKSFFIILMVIVACNSRSNNKPDSNSTATRNDSATTVKDTISNNEEINDSIINIRFPKDSTSITVSGKMKGINHPITVLIPIKQGKQLTAVIRTEDSLANVRINQIFMPDGKADGPFGKELKRAIHQQGTYKLIISENMMQGEEWKGKFMLTVKVE